MTQETEVSKIYFRYGETDFGDPPYSMMLEFLRGKWSDYDHFSLWYPAQEALWYYT